MLPLAGCRFVPFGVLSMPTFFSPFFPVLTVPRTMHIVRVPVGFADMGFAGRVLRGLCFHFFLCMSFCYYVDDVFPFHAPIVSPLTRFLASISFFFMD